MSLYDLLSGPGAWVAFCVFFIGLIGRAAFLVGLSLERDKQFYHHFDFNWSLRSIGHWLLPLGTESFREQKVFGVAFFVFHVCLLGVPIFLPAHNILFEETFGFSLWTLPEGLAELGTWLFIAAAAVLFARRIMRPEVRILSTMGDYLLIIVTVLPFITGYMAFRQIGDYGTMLTLHLLFSEILLIIVPFSKLGHIILFFFTRAYLGSEMGARREIDGRVGAKTW